MRLQTLTATVDIPGVILPLEEFTDRFQNLGQAADGSPIVYDSGINQYWIRGKVRLNESQRNNLYSFIENTVKFAYATFSLVPDATVNFGSGAGSAVIVRWWGNHWRQNRYTQGRFEVDLNFRREAT